MLHSWFNVDFVENQFEGQGPEEEEAGSEESENHPEHRREHLDKRCPEIVDKNSEACKLSDSETRCFKNGLSDGVIVLSNIFVDFRHFPSKIGHFLYNQCYDHFFYVHVW
jgi:hypothetical protein